MTLIFQYFIINSVPWFECNTNKVERLRRNNFNKTTRNNRTAYNSKSGLWRRENLTKSKNIIKIANWWLFIGYDILTNCKNENEINERIHGTYMKNGYYRNERKTQTHFRSHSKSHFTITRRRLYALQTLDDKFKILYYSTLLIREPVKTLEWWWFTAKESLLKWKGVLYAVQGESNDVGILYCTVHAKFTRNRLCGKLQSQIFRLHKDDLRL